MDARDEPKPDTGLNDATNNMESETDGIDFVTLGMFIIGKCIYLNMFCVRCVLSVCPPPLYTDDYKMPLQAFFFCASPFGLKYGVTGPRPFKWDARHVSTTYIK